MSTVEEGLMSPAAASTTKAKAKAVTATPKELQTAESLRTASEALIAAAEAISASATKLSGQPSKRTEAVQSTKRPTKSNGEVLEAPTTSVAAEATPISSGSKSSGKTQTEQAAEAEVVTDSGMTIDEFLAQELAAEAERNAGQPEFSSLSHYLRQYGTYVAMFVGAGLISGSMVHFPLAPMRYLAIGSCGAVLFSIASVATELRKGPATPARIGRVIATALLLSIGIGMTPGGIQHFGDFPGRAAKLIPGGIALSMTAFMVRDGYRLASERLLWLASGAVAALIVLAVALSVLAGNMAPSEGHSHGSAAETTATGAASDAHATEAPAEAEAAETEGSHGH